MSTAVSTDQWRLSQTFNRNSFVCYIGLSMSTESGSSQSRLLRLLNLTVWSPELLTSRLGRYPNILRECFAWQEALGYLGSGGLQVHQPEAADSVWSPAKDGILPSLPLARNLVWNPAEDHPLFVSHMFSQKIRQCAKSKIGWPTLEQLKSSKSRPHFLCICAPCPRLGPVSPLGFHAA